MDIYSEKMSPKVPGPMLLCPGWWIGPGASIFAAIMDLNMKQNIFSLEHMVHKGKAESSIAREPWKEMFVHDDVIKWKHFPRYWPFVRGIHWSPVNSPHKGQWHGASMFSLMYNQINGWGNNGEAGDLRRYRAHYDVTVMNLSVRIVPADGLAPFGGRTSAGSVMTMFGSHMYIWDWHFNSLWPSDTYMHQLINHHYTPAQ